MTLFEQLGLNKRGANELVDRFFNEIESALEAGDVVKLSGFGIFTLRQRPPGPGRNPNGRPDPELHATRHGKQRDLDDGTPILSRLRYAAMPETPRPAPAWHAAQGTPQSAP